MPDTPATDLTPAPEPRSLRRRVYNLLEVAGPGDRFSRVVDVIVLAMILANVTVVIVESTEPADQPLPAFYDTFEAVSVVFFSAEYLLRMWVSVESSRYRHPIFGRIAWAVTPMALCDLAAILPTLLVWSGAIGVLDLRVMRSLRLIRIFRLAKLTRYSTALQTFFAVLNERRGELVMTLFLLGVLLLMASSLMYSIENAEQKDAFASIPHAMWWAIATLTTVGYGDVYPVTTLGRVLGAIIAVLGIGMFALPAGILGAAFTEAIERQRRRRAAKNPTVCPHCGETIEPH